MTTIHYQFADGHFEEIEVTEEFAIQYAMLEKREKSIERRETRRHVSLEMLHEYGHDFGDDSGNPLTILIERETRRENKEMLKTAVSILTEEQRELLNMVYIKRIPQVQIAEQLGIKKSSVNDRLRRIFNKIKKVLN